MLRLVIAAAVSAPFLAQGAPIPKPICGTALQEAARISACASIVGIPMCLSDACYGPGGPDFSPSCEAGKASHEPQTGKANVVKMVQQTVDDNLAAVRAARSLGNVNARPRRSERHNCGNAAGEAACISACASVLALPVCLSDACFGPNGPNFSPDCEADKQRNEQEKQREEDKERKEAAAKLFHPDNGTGSWKLAYCNQAGVTHAISRTVSWSATTANNIGHSSTTDVKIGASMKFGSNAAPVSGTVSTQVANSMTRSVSESYQSSLSSTDEQTQTIECTGCLWQWTIELTDSRNPGQSAEALTGSTVCTRWGTEEFKPKCPPEACYSRDPTTDLNSANPYEGAGCSCCVDNDWAVGSSDSDFMQQALAATCPAAYPRR